MAKRAWKPDSMTWQLQPPADEADDLARQLSLPPLLVQVLYNRGLATPEAIRAFLDPKLTDLHDPQLLPGCAAAAERIARAIAAGEPICIYGDYDVDGITATAILEACLHLCEAPDIRHYVPHRLEEGYGLNVEAIEQIAAEGARLLITVDCGIGAAGPIARAGELGMDVIVTDHHVIQGELPAAVAVVHPGLASEGEPYPNLGLCGAGVAFKLAWQVAREVCGEQRVDDEMRQFLLDATTLAALGTIADVVPLLGENRTLATFGLRGLSGTSHVGLTALIESAGLAEKQIDAMHVGFVLGPRLNAAGRMGHARQAVELLTTDSPETARAIAAELNARNDERREVEQAITAEAVEMVTAGQLDAATRSIVLAGEGWHGGVIGIVASRLVDRFARPSILIAVDEAGMGQASGRSVPGLDLAGALAECAELLEGFGGHEMAAGLQIRKENISAFVERFEAVVAERLADTPHRVALTIDVETTLEALSFATVQQLEKMAPFGQGNARPVVQILGCDVVSPPRRMGRSGGHMQMVLSDGSGRARAVGFGMGDLVDAMLGQRRVDVAAVPVINTFNGRSNVELQLKDVRW